MGFFKSLFKVAKNIFTSPLKIVKGVVKGVKKLAKTKLGKVLIAGAAMFFGGPAILGALGSVGTAIGGAVSSAAATAGTFLKGVGSFFGISSGTGAGILGDIAASSGTAASTAGGSFGASAATAAASGATTATTGSSILSGLKSVATFIEANPTTTRLIAGAAQGALTPDPVQERLRLENEQRKNLFDVDISQVPGQQSAGLLTRQPQGPPQAPTTARQISPSQQLSARQPLQSLSREQDDRLRERKAGLLQGAG